ncbi:hypothetical protein BJY52DRAFT_1413834 [Lactarius psammicola]|nr:hypothetical protein BJY52DRAFT_1413834 [Lactarius psammicola]
MNFTKSIYWARGAERVPAPFRSRAALARVATYPARTSPRPCAHAGEHRRVRAPFHSRAVLARGHGGSGATLANPPARVAPPLVLCAPLRAPTPALPAPTPDAQRGVRGARTGVLGVGARTGCGVWVREPGCRGGASVCAKGGRTCVRGWRSPCGGCWGSRCPPAHPFARKRERARGRRNGPPREGDLNKRVGGQGVRKGLPRVAARCVALARAPSFARTGAQGDSATPNTLRTGYANPARTSYPLSRRPMRHPGTPVLAPTPRTPVLAPTPSTPVLAPRTPLCASGVGAGRAGVGARKGAHRTRGGATRAGGLARVAPLPPCPCMRAEAIGYASGVGRNPGEDRTRMEGCAHAAVLPRVRARTGRCASWIGRNPGEGRARTEWGGHPFRPSRPVDRLSKIHVK